MSQPSQQTELRRPAPHDMCPLQPKSLRMDRRTGTQTRLFPVKTPHLGRTTGVEPFTKETSESSDDELGRLDIDLDRKSREHNLTRGNVRAILHEVITHEHVIAMMKTAIRETQDLPLFEPKMTRSRLKKVVQAEQPLNFRQLTFITEKPPQFVDIELEDEEDSSDEEYCPDDEEYEEEEEEEDIADERSPGPMTSPCSPAEHSFLERLDAVEAEMDCSSAYSFNQSLDRDADEDEEDDDSGGGDSLAFRTRSKLHLVNVPLDQLEAELLAPDITADMYDLSAAQQEEDRHWTKWLQGLMAPDDEEEAEDDDDPEYNFLEDQDEPDLEDYRTDRAVQITTREVNELLDELFDTLQEEKVAVRGEEQQEKQEENEEEEEHEKEEEHEEEEAPSQTVPKFNVPQALHFEAPLAGMLSERRRTFKKRFEALQNRRALQDTTNNHQEDRSRKDKRNPQHSSSTPLLVSQSPVCPTLYLNVSQKLQLQQQMQQHVQLLTQVHLLSRYVGALCNEAHITKQYLEELQQFAILREEMFHPSSFRACNLLGAMSLLQAVDQRSEQKTGRPAAPAPFRRWLPSMTATTNSLAFPLLPANLAWIFATTPVFLYPELLPVCSLDPALHSQHHRSIYTAGEDGLIVLGLKHFEGAVQPNELISSYLLCKDRWSVRKHIKEMSSRKAPPTSVVKMFLTNGVVPPLLLACDRIDSRDQRPPVDRNVPNMPNWLKNSQPIIQKTRQGSELYPPSLPAGCNLRLHPSYKTGRQPRPKQKRLFTLAHNATLLPLAKAPGDGKEEVWMERQVDVDSEGLLLSSPSVLCPSPLVDDITQTLTGQQTPPLLLPLPDPTAPIMPCPVTNTNSGYLLLQVVTPPATSAPQSQHALGPHFSRPTHDMPPSLRRKEKEQDSQQTVVGVATLQGEGGEREQLGEEKRSLRGDSRQEGGSHEVEGGEWGGRGAKELREGQDVRSEGRKKEGETGGERGEEGEGERGQTGSEGSWVEDEEEEEGGEREEKVGEREGEIGEKEEEGGGHREKEEGGGERRGGSGEEGEEESREESGENEDGGGDKREDEGEKGERGEEEEEGEKDKEDDQGEEEEEEEEEEDFDDLTQDEDEEEVMSSASEESMLSVPELQETLKQLTWLASERRLGAEGDSEEEHSQTSPGSQEEEDEEEEEEGPKGEGLVDGRIDKIGGEEEMPSEEGTPRGGGGGGVRCPGRGRGRGRGQAEVSLRRNRQERRSKDTAKLLLLLDDNILDNDPQRESKDAAFAHSYLSRVREALQETPEQVEEFVSLLKEFEHVDDGEEVVLMFRKLRCILGERTDLLRDFAAFLHPEQALQCGLLEEQQAFERSRRFLRQLEISFGDNPSHYQKIIKALQTSPELSPSSIHELKSQMATLLKGHTHLQTEFWVFLDDLRPPAALQEQFEEAHWPEEGGGGSDGDAISQIIGGGASGGFEEVTLPDLEDEEEGPKIQPVSSRRQRRKMDAQRSNKDCDWLDCSGLESKMRRHRRKGCSHKTPGGMSKASQINREPGDKYQEHKDTDGSSALWEVSDRMLEEKEEGLDDDEEEEEDEEERRRGPAVKRSRREDAPQPSVNPTSSPSDPRITHVNPASSPVNPAPPSVQHVSSTSCTSPPVNSSSSSMNPTPSISQPVSAHAAPSPVGPAFDNPTSSSAPPDASVCAKNISLTASGEKVILWTREADRVILTTCQQEGANQNTFQSVSNSLGNKTPSEVSQRFRDLMLLFRSSARQTSSEEEAPPTEPPAAKEEAEGMT